MEKQGFNRVINITLLYNYYVSLLIYVAIRITVSSETPKMVIHRQTSAKEIRVIEIEIGLCRTLYMEVKQKMRYKHSTRAKYGREVSVVFLPMSSRRKNIAAISTVLLQIIKDNRHSFSYPPGETYTSKQITNLIKEK